MASSDLARDTSRAGDSDLGRTRTSTAAHRRKHIHGHTYRGHRRNSWVEQDTDWLVELRARQRTFDGAYIRTGIANFGYALLILKVFTAEFARIGLLYVILAVLLLLIGWRRASRSDHDFADEHRPLPDASGEAPQRPTFIHRISSSLSPSRRQQAPLAQRTPLPAHNASEPTSMDPIEQAAAQGAPREDEPAENRKSVPPNERVWGRPFRTGGNVVLLTGALVVALYVAIFVLIMTLA
ncbi:hypothetical protein OIV83_003777 [Microbotryomycetes sp. JL201]|nr:hypothetical protein OIV83_003777 [Microbotryomycetes sp. JL201]